MTRVPVQTVLPTVVDRTFPPQMVGTLAQLAEQSEVVDFALTYDQLVGFYPPQLWRPEFTPLAEVIRDNDSYADAFVLAALAVAAAPRLGIMVTHDAIRRGPAELTQTMLTLAGMTEAPAILLLGAGEVKQARPFGYRRSEGLDRLDDALNLWHRLLDCDGPFDFDGKLTRFRNAFIGTVRPRRPKVWILGAGPRLLDLGARHADGWFTVQPFAGHRPEEFALEVKQLKAQVERAGRDPDSFDICVALTTICHDDDQVVEATLGNPLVKYLAAIWGRFDQRAWARDGEEALFPPEWHYALRYIPMDLTQGDVDRIVAGVTPGMARKSFYVGGPEQVTADCRDFVEAGATHIVVYDLVAVTQTVNEALTGVTRILDIYRRLKTL